jgi:hypothetical protein
MDDIYIILKKIFLVSFLSSIISLGTFFILFILFIVNPLISTLMFTNIILIIIIFLESKRWV